LGSKPEVDTSIASAMKVGYPYLLVHPSDPDLYKIGVTILHPSPRETTGPTQLQPNVSSQDQRFVTKVVSLRVLSWPGSGAGDGNRTHGSSLGSLGITIIRRPPPRHCSPMLVRAAITRAAAPYPLERCYGRSTASAHSRSIARRWCAPARRGLARRTG
jgi:hypothetical protein